MAFRKGKMREKGRKWYKERGKCIIESRIEFPYPILMTLDRGKISGKISFSPLWVLIKKLDRNSGLHAKIREKSLVIKSEGFFGL